MRTPSTPTPCCKPCKTICAGFGGHERLYAAFEKCAYRIRALEDTSRVEHRMMERLQRAGSP